MNGRGILESDGVPFVRTENLFVVFQSLGEIFLARDQKLLGLLSLVSENQPLRDSAMV